MPVLFETPHAFDPTSTTVSVGTRTFDVLAEASEQSGRLVIDAPEELGALYGWARAKVESKKTNGKSK